VFVAGRDILGALLLGGPAESIDDYEEAPRALELWLTRAAEHGADLWDLSAIEAIARFVGPPEDEEDAERWAWRRKSGRWTEEMRSRVEAAARDLAADPRWALVVREALRRDPDDPIARDLAAFVDLAR
jgi:hypothetical protein